MKKHFLPIFIVFFSVVLFISCTQNQKQTKQGFFFDTIINITVDKKDIKAAEDAFSLCQALENTFSRTKKGSELWNINQGLETTLSADMKKVLEFSFDISEMTKGAFDVTVAPLSDLWNIKERTVPPTKEEIDAAIKNVGYTKVSLSPFDKGETTFDLGAVAKGYAADKIILEMKESGVKEAIVDLGGNVALIGEFTIGIRNPFSPEELFAKITLKDKSAVTSGAYQRHFDYKGTRYHHIIDPRTGECASSSLSSVTIISPSSMQADALSTAIFILGADAISLCSNFTDTDALIITNDGDVITTDGFEEKYNLEILSKD